MGVVYLMNRKEKFFYKYRPIYCTEFKTRKLRYCCLSSGCEGKLLFDFKSEEFQVTTSHTISSKSHEKGYHPKYEEIMKCFNENPDINYILILREYRGKKKYQNNSEDNEDE